MEWVGYIWVAAMVCGFAYGFYKEFRGDRVE